MKVLVVGSGGREHTLVWKISQSKRVSKIFCAPGNAGTSQGALNIDIAVDDINRLRDFCVKERVDLVIAGPEYPLTLGLADFLRKENIPVVGPNKNAAELEASKIFAKTIMDKYNVPTASYRIFNDPSDALTYLRNIQYPIVIKADGLAAGKGVIIAENIEEASSAIEEIMINKVFKDAGNRVLIEGFLYGEEASILAFVDGTDYIPMVTSQDHKKAYNGDKGPNTGGMGAYSPAPVISENLFKEVDTGILRPIVQGISDEGIYYQGILYVGLMITDKGPQVLEFNVRFGDPETQAVLPRLKSDIIDIFEAQVNNTLNSTKIEWDNRAALCVVMASGGYPNDYKKCEIITGLDIASKIKDVLIFHAGTKFDDSNIVTNGGRVLGVTGLGNDIEEAQKAAYSAVEKIHFNNAHYRTDIGYRAIGAGSS